MNKLITALILGTLALPAAQAADDMPQAGTGARAGGGHGKGMLLKHLKHMDTNADGRIAQAEFMAHHEAMWAKLPKDADGMVVLKDLLSKGGGMAP